jgi:hypothetical protein
MSPEAQKAFEAWFEVYDATEGGWGAVNRENCFTAFGAGWNAACAQTEVASTSAGGTPTAEDIYAAYPRKVGRGAAIKAIQKAAKLIAPKPSSMTRFSPYEVLLERTQAFAKATASWPEADRHFICHPATWFNRGSYDDDPKEWERGTAPASQFSVSH